MTSSGQRSVSAVMAAWPLLKGSTSCPSRRSNSETICTMVRSSSTNKTLAIGEKLRQSNGGGQGKWRHGAALPGFFGGTGRFRQVRERFFHVVQRIGHPRSGRALPQISDKFLDRGQLLR